MTQSQLKIFVSYRRVDEKIFVELLRTHFMHRYGRENVFMDFDSIPPFARFEDFIRQKVRECDVVAVMIGKRWLDIMHERAATGEPDYVRMELEEAVKHSKVIAPICMLGAGMPPADQLPETLRPIAGLNAVFISEGLNLLDNISRIMNGFEGELARRGAAREVVNPTSQQQIAAAQDAQGEFDFDDVADRFTDALEREDLPQALIWLAQLRDSGHPIPPFFNLEAREADLQARLRDEEERRRRREVADFQYKFVRRMIRLRDPQEQIAAAVREIWRVEPSYIPEDLIDILRPLLDAQPPEENLATAQSPADPVQAAFARARAFTGKRNKDWTPFITTFSDLKITDMPFCLVPVGSFQMGSDDGHYDDEQPVHPQTIHEPYWIQQYPLTNAQWALGVRAGAVGEPQGGDAVKWYKDRAMANAPVVGVTWFEVVKFAEWLGCRLPTEVEWEYAARGVESLRYPWGNDWNAELPVWDANSGGKPADVTTKPEGISWVGAAHLIGNVWEWCSSVYDQEAFPYPYKINDGREDVNRTDVPRVLRGGSWWNDKTNDLSAACRYRINPGIRYYFRGVRFARSR